MPPKGKQTQRERSKRLVDLGHRTRLREDYKAILACIQHREDLVSKVYRDLVDAGELDDQGRVLKNGDGSVKDEEDTGGAGAKDGGAEETCGIGNKGGAKGYQRWGTLPVSFLMGALTYAEPTILSCGNARCLVRRGCKYPPKEVLLQLLEMFTDIDPDEDVGPDSRMDVLCAHVKERNCMNGRRCRDLTLPDGLEEGLWEALMQPPVLKLRYRPTQQEVVIPGVHVQEGDEVNFFLAFSSPAWSARCTKRPVKLAPEGATLPLPAGVMYCGGARTGVGCDQVSRSADSRSSQPAWSSPRAVPKNMYISKTVLQARVAYVLLVKGAHGRAPPPPPPPQGDTARSTSKALPPQARQASGAVTSRVRIMHAPSSCPWKDPRPQPAVTVAKKKPACAPRPATMEEGERKPKDWPAAPSAGVHATGDTATMCAGGGSAWLQDAPPSRDCISVTAEKKE
jgi:hypothetical protein